LSSEKIYNHRPDTHLTAVGTIIAMAIKHAKNVIPAEEAVTQFIQASRFIRHAGSRISVRDRL